MKLSTAIQKGLQETEYANTWSQIETKYRWGFLPYKITKTCVLGAALIGVGLDIREKGYGRALLRKCIQDFPILTTHVPKQTQLTCSNNKTEPLYRALMFLNDNKIYSREQLLEYVERLELAQDIGDVAQASLKCINIKPKEVVKFS